ncbi:MAG: ImmA/IrrE family metallo-endopeptidase [Actinomycetota bacterium]|nr:ImmA/IrrE family metallo-endopeptidase [Actinomycetota bacterium]
MNRLKAVREIDGWTQHTLSEMLGVSTALISLVETGRRPLTFDISPTGYSNERFDLPDMSEPLHRQKTATRVTDTYRAKELVRLGGEIFTELRDRTPNAPKVRLDRLPAPRSIEEIESVAVELRLLLSLEASGPIRNLTAAVERVGVCLIPLVGLPGIDGLSAWVNGQPVIGLSPAVPGDRFRFSLSHELAHLLFHHQRSENAENEANRFAGALLVPRDDLDLALSGTSPTLKDFIGLKASTGMSVAALVYRAHELGHLDDSRYRSLQIQMARWRRSEPGEFPPVTGALLPRLVEEAGGHSTVAADLKMPVRHVSEVTNWSVLRAA